MLFKNVFTKKNKQKLLDFDGNELNVGDKVMSLRYDLGECEIIEREGLLYYKSLNKNEEVVYAKMIDAATKNQKVRKLN